MVLTAIASIQIGSALAAQLFETIGALGTVAWRLSLAALFLLAATRPRLPKDWRAALALLGVALLAPIGASALDPVGLLFAALAGAAWAGFVLLSAPIAKRMPGNSGLTFGMGIAALLTLPFGIAPAAIVFTDPLTLGTLIAVALLSTAIPFSLEFQALKRMSATIYGTLIALEPGAAALAGAWVLDESLTLRSFAALLCVSTAALGQALTAKQTPT